MTSKQVIGQFGADHRNLNAATLRSQVVRTQDAQAAQLFLGANAPDVITAATGTCSLQTSVTYVQGAASPVVTLPLPSTTLFGNELQNGMLKSFVLTTAGSATIQPALPVGTMDVTMVLPNQSVTYMWCGPVVGWALWNAPGAGTTNLPLYIANSLFVNKHLNIPAGARERFDLPYFTISAAMADALPGDTVFVYPGASINGDPYVEDFTLPAGVSLLGYAASALAFGKSDVILKRAIEINGTITVGTATSPLDEPSYISGVFVNNSDLTQFTKPCVHFTAGSTGLVNIADCSLVSVDGAAVQQDAVGAGDAIVIISSCALDSSDSVSNLAITAINSDAASTVSVFVFVNGSTLNGAIAIRNFGLASPISKGLSVTDTSISNDTAIVADVQNCKFTRCVFQNFGAIGTPSITTNCASQGGQPGKVEFIDCQILGHSWTDTSKESSYEFINTTFDGISLEMSSTTADTVGTTLSILNSNITCSDVFKIGILGTPLSCSTTVSCVNVYAESEVLCSLTSTDPQTCNFSNCKITSRDAMLFQTMDTVQLYDFGNCRFICGGAAPILLDAILNSACFTFTSCSLQTQNVVTSLANNAAALAVVSGGNNSTSAAIATGNPVVTQTLW
jgi:hypothetical protein